MKLVVPSKRELDKIAPNNIIVRDNKYNSFCMGILNVRSDKKPRKLTDFIRFELYIVLKV